MLVTLLACLAVWTAAWVTVLILLRRTDARVRELAASAVQLERELRAFGDIVVFMVALTHPKTIAWRPNTPDPPRSN
jgi:hypothetical protein